MRKLVLVFMCLLLAVPAVWGAPARAESVEGFAGGDGSVGSPFLITTYDQLFLMKEAVEDLGKDSAHFKLGAHIEAGEGVWKPISKEFNGMFDGAMYTIAGLNIEADGSNVGLFGVTGVSAYITNVHLRDAHVRGSDKDNVGTLVGDNWGWVTQSSVEDTRVGGGGANVGGLVGLNNGIITESFVTGRVEGLETDNVQIWATGIGGLVGGNNGTIENCFSHAEVEGWDDIGGLVGVLMDGGVVRNSYVSTSQMNSRTDGEQPNLGILIGIVDGGVVEQSFWYKKDCGETNQCDGYHGESNGTLDIEYFDMDEENWDYEQFRQEASEWGESVWRISGAYPYPYLIRVLIEGDGPIIHAEAYARGGKSEPIIEQNDRTTTYTYDFTAHVKIVDLYIEAPKSVELFGSEGEELDHYNNSAHYYFRIDLREKISDEMSIETRAFLYGDQQYIFKFNKESIPDMSFDGLGTDEEPYEIKSAADLYLLGLVYDQEEYKGMVFKQINDINLNQYSSIDGGKGWVPIGFIDVFFNEDTEDWEPLSDTFQGTYDGNGKKIEGLRVNRPYEWVVGLFGTIGEYGVVKNLNIEGGSVIGAYSTGALVGINEGIVTNVSASAIVEGDANIGGLIGSNSESGKVINGSSIASVIGNDVVGGLVGENYGLVDDSYVSGTSLTCEINVNCDVSGYNHVGGLVGYNFGQVIKSNSGASTFGNAYIGGLAGDNDEEITDSFAYGTVRGIEAVGGLVGGNFDLISQSFASGDVYGIKDVGGLAGMNSKDDNTANVINSYASGNVYGVDHVGGLVGLNHSNVMYSYSFGDVGLNPNGQTGSDFGGLIGKHYTGGYVLDSFATGNVDGGSSVGGLIGYSFGSNTKNSYSSGQVSGQGPAIGGFIGKVDGGSFESSYWNTTKSQRSNGYGEKGIDINESVLDFSGLNSDEMKNQTKFIGWNFITVWKMDDAGPFLQVVDPSESDLSFEALNGLIPTAEHLVNVTDDDSEFDPGDVANLRTAIEAAYAAYNTSQTQDDVDAAVESLETAINIFKSKAIGVLTALISKADDIHDRTIEGTGPGEYAIGSKSTFNAKIQLVAEVELNQVSAVTVIETIHALREAIEVFESGKVPEDDNGVKLAYAEYRTSDDDHHLILGLNKWISSYTDSNKFELTDQSITITQVVYYSEDNTIKLRLSGPLNTMNPQKVKMLQGAVKVDVDGTDGIVNIQPSEVRIMTPEAIDSLKVSLQAIAPNQPVTIVNVVRFLADLNRDKDINGDGAVDQQDIKYLLRLMFNMH